MTIIEKLVAEAIAKHEGLKHTKCEKEPPDFLLVNCEGQKINLEVTRLMQPSAKVFESPIKNSKLPSRLGDDATALIFLNKLKEDKCLVKFLEDKKLRLSLQLESPIQNITDTAKKFLEEFASLVQQPEKDRKPIHGNNIKFKLINNAANIYSESVGISIRPKGSGIFTTNILLNAKIPLEERICTKNDKILNYKVHTEQKWLDFYNDYFLADFETYQQAYKMVSPSHSFDKIFVVNKDKEVYVLYHKQQENSPVPSNNL